MKVEIADASPVEKRMTVSIPSETVDNEINKTYLDLKKNVKLRGFRPGKTPVAVLQRYFKAQVEEDVATKLVKETYPIALDEQKLLPVSQPKIENGVLEKGKDFSYTAVFETQPEIDICGYEGLEIDKEKIEVSDEDVDKEIETLQNSHSTLENRDEGVVEKGNYVVLDYDGKLNEKDFPGGARKDFLLEVGDDNFLPGFGEQVIGLKKDDKKSFSLAIPEDYRMEELAGKTAELTIHVKEIKEKVSPDVDDEFAKDLGDYADLEDLKKKTREMLLTSKTQQAEQCLKEKIFDALIEKNPFDVPNSMVENQIQNMIMNAQQMLQAQGLKLEDMGQSTGQLFEQYRQPAERQVRSALLLDAVGKKEGLVAEEADFEEKYKEIAEQINQDMKSIKGKIDPEMLRPQIIEKKAIELILSKSSITEK